VLMEEEIFGPILPIVRTAHVELAVDFIQSKLVLIKKRLKLYKERGR